MSARLVVADDHPITRAGTIAIVQRDSELQIVGEAGDGAEALAICREQLPDLLLLDVRLPGMSGIAVAQEVKGMVRPPHVLMLSAYSDATSVHAALEAGAAGYVLKSAAGADLLAAIHQVLRGEHVLLGVSGAVESSETLLTPQEIAVMRYVAEGLTSKEISQRISGSGRPLTARTIETYLVRIYQKLGARNRAEAVTRAQRDGLLV